MGVRAALADWDRGHSATATMTPARPHVVIATKGGLERTGYKQWAPNLTKAALLASIRRSHAAINLMGCESAADGKHAHEQRSAVPIELWQLHVHGEPTVPIEETLAAAVEAVREGLVRHIGLCNVKGKHAVETIERARKYIEREIPARQTLAEAKESGGEKVGSHFSRGEGGGSRATDGPVLVSIQNEYSPWKRQMESNGVLRYCEANGLVFMPHGALGGTGAREGRKSLAEDFPGLQLIADTLNPTSTSGTTGRGNAPQLGGKPVVLGPAAGWGVLPQVFCDLDGVLCDFELGVRTVSGGASPDEMGASRMWSMLARVPSPGFFAGLEWMEEGGGERLWRFLEAAASDAAAAAAAADASQPPSSSSSPPSTSRHPQAAILTIITGCPHGSWAPGQKRAWCARKLGHTAHSPHLAVITCMSRDKHKWCSGAVQAASNESAPPPLLIDDRAKNCEQWRAAGGVAIQHTSADSTIAELRRIGFSDTRIAGTAASAAVEEDGPGTAVGNNGGARHALQEERLPITVQTLVLAWMQARWSCMLPIPGARSVRTIRYLSRLVECGTQDAAQSAEQGGGECGTRLDLRAVSNGTLLLRVAQAVELREEYTRSLDERLRERDPAAIADAVVDLVASSSLPPPLDAALQAMVPKEAPFPSSPELLVSGGKFLKGVCVFFVGGLGEGLSNGRATILAKQVVKAGGVHTTASSTRPPDVLVVGSGVSVDRLSSRVVATTWGKAKGAGGFAALLAGANAKRSPKKKTKLTKGYLGKGKKDGGKSAKGNSSVHGLSCFPALCAPEWLSTCLAARSLAAPQGFEPR
jgi:aryl-alcohol dehydrogenase-like predicted oxidoreductase